jgi:hypothetical protein
MKAQINNSVPALVATRFLQCLDTISTQAGTNEKMTRRKFLEMTRRAARSRRIRTAKSTTKNQENETNSEGRTTGNSLEESDIRTMALKNLGREVRGSLECKGAPGELKLNITVLAKTSPNFVLPNLEEQMWNTGKLEPATQGKRIARRTLVQQHFTVM